PRRSSREPLRWPPASCEASPAARAKATPVAALRRPSRGARAWQTSPAAAGRAGEGPALVAAGAGPDSQSESTAASASVLDSPRVEAPEVATVPAPSAASALAASQAAAAEPTPVRWGAGWLGGACEAGAVPSGTVSPGSLEAPEPPVGRLWHPRPAVAGPWWPDVPWPPRPGAPSPLPATSPPASARSASRERLDLGEMASSIDALASGIGEHSGQLRPALGVEAAVASSWRTLPAASADPSAGARHQAAAASGAAEAVAPAQLSPPRPAAPEEGQPPSQGAAKRGSPRRSVAPPRGVLLAVASPCRARTPGAGARWPGPGQTAQSPAAPPCAKQAALAAGASPAAPSAPELTAALVRAAQAFLRARVGSPAAPGAALAGAGAPRGLGVARLPPRESCFALHDSEDDGSGGSSFDGQREYEAIDVLAAARVLCDGGLAPGTAPSPLCAAAGAGPPSPPRGDGSTPLGKLCAAAGAGLQPLRGDWAAPLGKGRGLEEALTEARARLAAAAAEGRELQEGLQAERARVRQLQAQLDLAAAERDAALSRAELCDALLGEAQRTGAPPGSAGAPGPVAAFSAAPPGAAEEGEREPAALSAASSPAFWAAASAPGSPAAAGGTPATPAASRSPRRPAAAPQRPESREPKLRTLHARLAAMVAESSRPMAEAADSSPQRSGAGRSAAHRQAHGLRAHLREAEAQRDQLGPRARSDTAGPPGAEAGRSAAEPEEGPGGPSGAAEGWSPAQELEATSAHFVEHEAADARRRRLGRSLLQAQGRYEAAVGELERLRLARSRGSTAGGASAERSARQAVAARAAEVADCQRLYEAAVAQRERCGHARASVAAPRAGARAGSGLSGA
ncbi:unnamed protein product, partial [Prorocentrum cordatum]